VSKDQARPAHRRADGESGRSGHLNAPPGRNRMNDHRTRPARSKCLRRPDGESLMTTALIARSAVAGSRILPS